MSASKFIYPHLSKIAPKLTSSLERRRTAAGSTHLLPGLSLAQFFGSLRERGVRSVLLPPIENEGLPELLLADEDVHSIRDLVTDRLGGPPIKLYSGSGGRRELRFEPPGLPPEVYAMSLFPPRLAENLLNDEHEVCGSTGANMLGPLNAFLSGAYRAAYLHPECWEAEGAQWVASPDCAARLKGLANSAGIAFKSPVTPRVLDELLAARGWRPSHDLLERVSSWMPWIRDLLPREEAEPGITVFFIRERAVDAGLQSPIVDALCSSGFEPIAILDLTDEQAHRAAHDYRGGNWGRGPYRVSGGPPKTICVTLDLLPLEVGDTDRGSLPGCDNRRILEAKTAARKLVNAGIAPVDHYNPVHSTDNSAQAWRAIRAIIPERERELRKKVEELRRQFASDGIVRDLTKHGRRAKVELIDFSGARAIRKTFRPSALRFMDREIEVMERLALCPEIPSLLARGHNHVIVEYVGGDFLPSPGAVGFPRPLPLPHVRRLARLIRTSLANGFDPIDLRPDANVIYDGSQLHLIDFEFWRECDPATAPEESMCLSGIPADDIGDRPRATSRNLAPYRVGWYPYTLLGARSFLYDPAWLQRLKRAGNLMRAYVRWAWQASFRTAKRTLKAGARRCLGLASKLRGSEPPKTIALR